MARLTIGLGMLISSEEREGLEAEALALPDDWDVDMSGDSSSGLFTVVVRIRWGPLTGTTSKSFTPGAFEHVRAFLKELREKNAQP